MMDNEDLKFLSELRETIRTGHELLKDLRAAHKAIKETINNCTDTTVDRFRAKLDEQGKLTAKAVEHACESASELVYKRFDKISAILMGGERNDMSEDLLTLSRRVRAAMDAKGIK